MKAKSYFHAVGMILVLLLVTSPAIAVSSETEATLAKIRAIGKAWNRKVNKQTKAIYIPLLQKGG